LIQLVQFTIVVALYFLSRQRHQQEAANCERKKRRKLEFNISMSMECNTFARTSARLYRIVDAEGRWWLILFNIISRFCGLKCMDINKANKSKKIRYNIDFTFHHQKEVAKTEYVWTMWRHLTLLYINRCALMSATTFLCSTIHKTIKKVEFFSK
jgi:hypothetical protein